MTKAKIGRVVIVLLAVGAAGGGGWWWQTHRPETLADALVLYGNVDIRQVNLAFNGNEHVTSMQAQEGDRVSKGQLLATLGTHRLESAVAREREQDTFDQLLVTPFRPIELLIGKALPGLMIGISEATAIILVAVLWFEVPLLGSLWPGLLWVLYTGLALFVVSAVGVGLMISSLAVTMQQGLLGTFLFRVPAITLSGFTTPIANMPPLVQSITRINPMRYFLVILRSVFLEDTPFHPIIDQFWPMAVIGAASLTLAGWLFRHRLY